MSREIGPLLGLVTTSLQTIASHVARSKWVEMIIDCARGHKLAGPAAPSTSHPKSDVNPKP